MENLVMKSSYSATRFGEAYPLGNGHMGAMVYGSAPRSEILFSENTFFSGEKSEENNQPKASEAFRRMRDAAQNDNYAKVHKEAEDFIGVRRNYGTNLPVGKLYLNYGILGQEVRLKERSLAIKTGLAENCYQIKKNGHESRLMEKMLISHPQKCFGVRAEDEAGFSVQIHWKACNNYGVQTYTDNGFTFTCKAYETMHCDENTGVTLSGKAQVYTDGHCQKVEDGIQITNAKVLELYMDMQTDFCIKAGIKNGEVQKSTPEEKKLDTDWNTLEKNHCSDVSTYMDRVGFTLGGKKQDAPASGHTCHKSKEIEFEYQYGRYLLLSASRTDSILPAHLQGIWNDSVACNIGWTCDMHLDINTQMNYWLSEPCALPEMGRPLFSWMKGLLVPQGEKTAEVSYGLIGWAAELVSNAWGFAAPYWASPIAPCPTGGIWAMMQLWEHFLYSEDEEFLRRELYPMQKGAIDFFLGYIYQRADGTWTSGPSISPENSFCYDGGVYQISEGPTYEIVMIKELFDTFIKASDCLGETGEAYQKVKSILPNLLPYRVLEDGTLAEYHQDFQIPDSQHRHTSHLLGLFPFWQVNPKDTPELCKAAERTIEAKLTPEEKWEDTGWARSLLLLYEARLLHGEHAYRHMDAMLEKLQEPNGMIYHPPTRGAGAFDHVYELDGNTGLTMGITEMLMQSREGVIHLLPAWTREFPCGSIKGLRAKGRIVVSFQWDAGEVTSFELLSEKDQDLLVEMKDTCMKVNLIAGERYIFSK